MSSQPTQRVVDLSASLVDPNAGKGLAAQTLTVTMTPHGGVATPLPSMTTTPDGSALQTVTVQVPQTYTFAISYAGGTVGVTQYNASNGSTTLHVGAKTLKGTVSAERSPGEVVTCIVTRTVDGHQDTLTALTQLDLSWSVEYDGTVLGGYSFIAKIGPDGIYSAASTPPIPFTI